MVFLGSSVINTSIDLSAALAAAGVGLSAENHSDNVQVTSLNDGPPSSEITILSGGESGQPQEGSILQVTNQDADNAAALNTVAVYQASDASEGQILNASGLEISNAQAGWAGASGEGASAAEAVTTININAASLGMNKP